MSSVGLSMFVHTQAGKNAARRPPPYPTESNQKELESFDDKIQYKISRGLVPPLYKDYARHQRCAEKQEQRHHHGNDQQQQQQRQGRRGDVHLPAVHTGKRI